jgi:hypothetical protein
MARAGCTLTFESVRVGAPTPTSTSTSPRQGDRLVLLPPAATWSTTTALPGDALTTSATGAPLDSTGRVRKSGRGVCSKACVAVAALVALFVSVPVAVAIWDASRAA